MLAGLPVLAASVEALKGARSGRGSRRAQPHPAEMADVRFGMMPARSPKADSHQQASSTVDELSSLRRADALSAAWRPAALDTVARLQVPDERAAPAGVHLVVERRTMRGRARADHRAAAHQRGQWAARLARMYRAGPASAADHRGAGR
jgi:hypothetical protein